MVCMVSMYGMYLWEISMGYMYGNMYGIYVWEICMVYKQEIYYTDIARDVKHIHDEQTDRYIGWPESLLD